MDKTKEELAGLFRTEYRANKKHYHEELLNNLSQLVSSHLAKKHPDFHIGDEPQLKIASVTEAYEQCLFKISVAATYTYGDCICEKTAGVRIRFKSKPKYTPLSAKEYTERRFESIASSLAALLTKNVPASSATYEKLVKVFTKVTIARNSNFANWLEDNLKTNLPQATIGLEKSLTDSLNNATKSELASDGCLKASIQDFGLKFLRREKYAAIIEAAFELYYSDEHSYHVSETIKVQPTIAPAMSDKTIFDETLNSELSKVLLLLQNKILSTIPVFVTFDDDAVAANFLNTIQSLSDTNPYATCAEPYIRNQSGNPYFIIWAEPVQLACGTPAQYEIVNDIEWQLYEKSVLSPYSIERTELPLNIYELSQFIKQANECFAKTEHTAFPEGKPIKYQFNKSNNLIYSFLSANLRASNLKPADMTIKEWLNKILEDYVQAYQEDQNRKSTCLQKLNELNLGPLELSVLKYVYENQKTWFSDISANLETTPEFTKTSIGNALTSVADMSINVAGRKEKLLDSEWRHSRKHYCDYCLYTTNPQIPHESVGAAKGRPFSKEDVQNIVPSDKEKWCQQLCANAQTREELWNALQILEGLPKTTLAQAAKDPIYQAFFTKFTGSDALYVKYLLQSLPGCKRIANTLFPE